MYCPTNSAKNIKDCYKVWGEPVFSKGILHSNNNNYYASDSHVKRSPTMALSANQLKISNFNTKK
jgi:hypothetical protein